VAKLTAAASKVWAENVKAVTWPFQPVIDSQTGIIPRPPLSSWSLEDRLKLPLITGFCTNEATTFIPMAHTPQVFQSFFKTLIPSLSDTDLSTLESLYHLSEFPEPPPMRILGSHWRRLEAAYADYGYIAPVLQTAHFLSSESVPVYVYEFAAKAPPFGLANHTDESTVVSHDIPSEEAQMSSGHGALPLLPGLEKVSEEMHGLFSAFVSCDNFTELEQKWPRFVSPLAGGDGKILVFGEGNDERMGGHGHGEKGVVMRVRAMTDREVERCSFWWERVHLSQGFGTRSG
jgi:carboxylesterase type B